MAVTNQFLGGFRLLRVEHLGLDQVRDMNRALALDDRTVRVLLILAGVLLDHARTLDHRALLAGLAEFETDLHRHVHKENNVLFPRALARAGSRG